MNWAIKRHSAICFANLRSGALISFLMALLIGIGAGCHSEPTPKMIVGDWVSRDDRYEGRVLKITPTSVEIIVEGDSVASYTILSSRAIQDKARLKVMFNLKDQHQSSSNMMLNYSLNKDTLWLENRPDIIWYRFRSE